MVVELRAAREVWLNSEPAHVVPWGRSVLVEAAVGEDLGTLFQVAHFKLSSVLLFTILFAVLQEDCTTHLNSGRKNGISSL